MIVELIDIKQKNSVTSTGTAILEVFSTLTLVALIVTKLKIKLLISVLVGRLTQSA